MRTIKFISVLLVAGLLDFCVHSFFMGFYLRFFFFINMIIWVSILIICERIDTIFSAFVWGLYICLCSRWVIFLTVIPLSIYSLIQWKKKNTIIRDFIFHIIVVFVMGALVLYTHTKWEDYKTLKPFPKPSMTLHDIVLCEPKIKLADSQFGNKLLFLPDYQITFREFARIVEEQTNLYVDFVRVNEETDCLFLGPKVREIYIRSK